ncbi:MAG: M66 family metalloprotease, partial [Polyangiales bacterium]
GPGKDASPKPGTDSSTPPPDPADTAPPPPGTDTSPVDPGPDPTTGLEPAKDLNLSEIAVFQGVKVSIEKAGAKVSSRRAPVVAGRIGLVRAYVMPGSTYTAREVTGVLTITTGGVARTYSDKKTLSAASTDATLTSTFNFTLDAASIGTDSTYSVALMTAPGQTATGAIARYPASGAESFDAGNSGDVMKIKLVPVQYNADGTGRLPDTSGAQIEIYRQRVMALYPAKKVEITVRAPYPYSGGISASGSGFSEILQAIVRLRASDGAPKDVFYFGAFAPTSSFSSYCGGGCVTGLSGLLTSPTDASGRASVGIGFTGPSSADTMAHEIGHAHGRSHAPGCGAAGTDPSFPYSGAGIGVFGYDVNTKGLVSPTKFTDMMGYCNPVWLSDYTYGALFTRMNYIATHPYIHYGPDVTTKYRFVSVGMDGKLTWGEDITLDEPPLGEEHTVTYVAADGKVVESATGHYYPYEDLAGGYMLVPQPVSAVSSIHLAGMPGGVQSKLVLAP